jgi:hypothetical protein
MVSIEIWYNVQGVYHMSGLKGADAIVCNAAGKNEPKVWRSKYDEPFRNGVKVDSHKVIH